MIVVDDQGAEREQQRGDDGDHKGLITGPLRNPPCAKDFEIRRALLRG